MAVSFLVRVGRRIQDLRMGKGISQAMLADYANITRAALSRIENGRAEPGLLTLVDLAKGLGVTLHEFFKGM